MLLSLTLPGQAQEGSRRVPLSTPQRTALVIGNSQYSTGPLRNPVNDARDMADVLKKVGFAVTVLTDVNQAQMETAVVTLSQQLRYGGVGLFYFAGHGTQLDGQNYLWPVGTPMTTPADMRYKAVQASWVQARMEEAGNALNVLILDACRDNPFASDKRSGQQGLAAMQAGTETLIAFAALPGQVAADGQGRNSPYTKHLVQQLTRPGLQVEEVFKRVRDAVVQETGGKQRPQEWTTLTREFRFVEGPSAPPQRQPEDVAVRDPEEAMWRLVEQSTNPDDVKRFLREYPKGRYAPAARLKLAQVERQPAPAGGPQVAVGSYPPPEPPTASRTWRNTIGIEFVLIQAGEFLMGSNSDKDSAKPPHQVRISKPFYLGQYEMTQGQWQAVMGNNPSSFKGDAMLPVENVSWEDVQEFLRRLNAREGGPKYRLPTEAEWEYAARAGTTTAYSFGDSERQLGGYAWCGEGTETHPVGQKKPNAWGLYDMHGNVWEWVQDWYGPYKAGAAVDPAGPSSGSNRVYRGGSWFGSTWDCRSANRVSEVPSGRGYSDAVLGFRLLREVQ